MPMVETRFSAVYNVQNNLYELRGVQTTSAGDYAYMPLSLNKIEEGCITTPFAYLSKPDVERLMDALWEAGVRPTTHKALDIPKGELAAVRDHLEDMRKITFSLMELQK